MTQRPNLLFYCQHAVGMGHLIRSLALAEALADHFRVVFLNGGRVPDNITFPANIEPIDLPPLGLDQNQKLVSLAPGYQLQPAMQVRRQQILNIFNNLNPRVLFIELFPFGRKKFAFELLPLLKLAKAGGKSVNVCSLRDILVDQRRNQQHHDDRARWLVDRYFDAVLVHADPSFVTLSDSFKPRLPLSKPVWYTGFVSPRQDPTGAAREPLPAIPKNSVVISAGGGSVGGRLLSCVLEAYPRIQSRRPVPLVIIAGPFLSDSEWLNLQRKSNNFRNLTLLRSVPDLRALLKNAAASISQCGYNTAVDVLMTGVPALFVPYSRGEENEQLRRAQNLARRQLALCLPESELTPESLAHGIGQLQDFRPAPHRLNLDGASASARRVAELNQGGDR